MYFLSSFYLPTKVGLLFKKTKLKPILYQIILELQPNNAIFAEKKYLIMNIPLSIYVASSWRNEFYPDVVMKLREAGFEVYDFRNPPSGDPGFKWSCISEDFMEWSPERYRDMLKHPKAERQFGNDIKAMEACDACVLVLPCGRSAHTEAGWFAGRGKKVLAYIPEKQEPELMYKLFSGICCSIEELIEALK